MRKLISAALAAVLLASSAGAKVTDFFSSFYVMGDSLSDDGNINGLIWQLATGGSPYVGNWRDGGTFTNGDVWNEPLQNTFRKAGHDADNFATGAAQSSGGNWLIPDLDRQIDNLIDTTSKGDRGKNPLVSVWIGGNNILDAVGDGNGLSAAFSAAKSVAQGIKRLAEKAAVDEFLVFNLPDLGEIPEFRLFETGDRKAAREAGEAYNAELARRMRSIERTGLNIIDIDVYSLFGDVIANPASYGFSNVRLPCVFPSKAEAKKYGQPERCSATTAKTRLFMDALHPNALAHRIVGDLVEDTLEAEVLARSSARVLAAPAGPQPVPIPGSLALLAGALAATAALRPGRRRAACASCTLSPSL